MKNISKILRNFVYLGIVMFFWLFISNLIQAFNCPKMSQTELFMQLPNSFIGNWKYCK